MPTTCVPDLTLSTLTTIGSFHTNFAWRTLGYVFSSIVSIPSICTEYITNIFLTAFYYIVAMVTTMNNMCILLIVIILCVLYIKLSKSNRNCGGQSLHPPSRRAIRSPNYFHFDQEFESDVEYSDTSCTQNFCARLTLGSNNNLESETNDGIRVDDISDMNNISDSDIEVEQSDSDDSNITRIFSTESTNCRMDRCLYPLSQYSTLYCRNSEGQKMINSTEDFEIERDKWRCVVCQIKMKSVVILPCKHLCMCAQCANQIVTSQVSAHRVCPLCRAKIARIMSVYL